MLASRLATASKIGNYLTTTEQTPERPAVGLVQSWRRWQIWSDARTAIIAAVVGVIVGWQVSTITQRAQFREDRHQEAQALMRPVYKAFEVAANAYATAEVIRAPCRPGTDLPISSTNPCRLTVQELQHARYNFQVAINDMYEVATPKAILALQQVAGTLPASLIGPSGLPLDGHVDGRAFAEAFNAFRVIAGCDINPTLNSKHC